MAKKVAFITMAVIILIYIDQRVRERCFKWCAGENLATVSTVTTGNFSETIPQTGAVTENNKLAVPIDEMYRKRIKNGLLATASINDVTVRFQISQIDSIVINGRFSVIMDLTDTVMSLPRNNSVRLRIHLSEPREAILIPVGGFYKDTGGQWIYVLTNEKRFERRTIKLGPKNPEYFTVLEGLTPGDKVLTSSYENFAHKINVSLWEIERTKPVSMM